MHKLITNLKTKWGSKWLSKLQENDKKEKKKITLRHRTHDPCNSRAVSTTIPRLPGIAIEAVQIIMFWQRVPQKYTKDVKFASRILKNINFGFYPYTDVC